MTKNANKNNALVQHFYSYIFIKRNPQNYRKGQKLPGRFVKTEQDFSVDNVFVSLCFLPSKQIISERYFLLLFFLYWYCPKYRTKITILALKLGIQMEIFLLVKTQKRLWIKRWLRANIHDRRSSFSFEIPSEMIQHGTISHSEQLLRIIFHFMPHGSSWF